MTSYRASEKLYHCLLCGNSFPADQVVVRQVRYRQPGQNGRVIKSKNVGYYCLVCMDTDETLDQIPPVLLQSKIRELRGVIDASPTGRPAPSEPNDSAVRSSADGLPRAG